MKLIRQSRLYFKEGRSDKVYETDLCQVSDHEYVVNFRFGRRGTRLQEGTKTIFPVSLLAAEKIFDRLVKSKIKKGYQETSAPVLTVVSDQTGSDQTGPETDQIPKVDDPAQAAIILNLKNACEGKKLSGKRKVSRIIWRAGEMKLTSAVPYLIRLSDSKDEMQKYSAVWALGRCGNSNQDALDALIGLYKSMADSDVARQMALEAICLLNSQQPDEQDDEQAGSSRPQQNEFSDLLINSLPDGIREVFETEDSQKLYDRLNEFIFKLKSASNQYLITLYLLSFQYPHINDAILKVLSEIPFAPNYFHVVRRLFKAAEFREDNKMFGLIAHRFDTTPPYYQKGSYGNSAYVKGRYIRNIKKEMQKEKPDLAYSKATRQYLRKRVVRTIRHMGELENPAYPEMAAGILLHLDDAKNLGNPWQHTRYYEKDGRYRQETINYDVLSEYPAVNFILYRNSPRYEKMPDNLLWRCKPSYKPGGDIDPEIREEAFPQLWDNAPDVLINLLCQSNCLKVHEFAVKASLTNTRVEKGIKTPQLLDILKKPYEITILYALDLCKKIYSPDNPDMELIAGLISCALERARSIAVEWMEKDLVLFMTDPDIAKAALFCIHKDIRDWLESILLKIQMSDSDQEIFIGRAISGFMNFSPDLSDDLSIEDSLEIIKDAAKILIAAFSDKLKDIGPEVIRDLINHPNSGVKAFGGMLMLNHRKGPENLPEDLLTLLMNSDDSHVQGIGVQVFCRMSDHALAKKHDMLAGFLLSEVESIRNAAVPAIETLCASDRSFADKFIRTLLPALLFKEAWKGAHDHLVNFFSQRLTTRLDLIDPKMCQRLLKSRFAGPGKLADFLLEQGKIFIDTMEFENIASLAHHENASIRRHIHTWLEKNPERVKKEKQSALSILDSNWDDTRTFAINFFETEFKDSDWTPELIVSMCDSVKDDVQTFGLNMVTKFFHKKDGHEYLLKLSQHPAGNLQLFASNFLFRFASDNPDRIKGLKPYFLRVLSSVNKSRVAKTRIFAFLKTEVEKNEETAYIAANILTRISATVAIRDKAECIEILHKISNLYPENPKIETRLEPVQVPMYS